MKDELPISTKIYLRAAELIEQGHCKNAAHIEKDGKHYYCAVGALYAAGNEYGQQDDCIVWAEKYFSLGEKVGGDVPRWNNHPDTTAEMVASKLREQAFA